MRAHVLLPFLSTLIPSAIAVFADEAYHTDYHHALLGIPQEHTTFFHQPRAHSKASLLYTLSEKLVLGAVNPKDGALVWRQFLNPSSNLTSPVEGFLRAGENEDTVISAVGSKVSAWDGFDGKLAWRNEFADAVAKDLEVIEFEDGQTKKGGKDVVVLFAGEHGVVRRISGETGDVVWEHTDESGDIPHQVSTSGSHIYLISLSAASRTGMRIKVTTLDLLSGRQRSQYTLNTESAVSSPRSILFVGANSASPLIAWVDKASKALKVNVIGSKHVNAISIQNDRDEDITKIKVHAPHVTKSLPHFLVHYQSETSNWAEVYHVDLSAYTVAKAYALPKLAGKGAFSTSTQDANVFFTRTTENELLLFSSASHGVLARWETATTPKDSVEQDYLLHGVSEVISRPDSSFAVRAALTTSIGEWKLVRNGEPVWKRVEALAGAIAAEWAELPELKDLARELEVEVHGNFISAYIHRLKRHAKDLKYFPAWLERLPARIIGGITGSEDEKPLTSDDAFSRDSFGFRKLVVVATENGRLYALSHADQGKIIWSMKAADLSDGQLWDVRSMFADNAESLMIVKDASGATVVVETTTGTVVSPGGKDGTKSGEHGSGATWQRDVNDGKLASLLPTQSATVILQGEKGEVKGKRYSEDGTATIAWEFRPTAGERVVELTVRPYHDPVASVGRVLGDRSVMYKYLSPNLLLITTVSDATNKASFHLLDSVSGNVLYTTMHQGVDVSRSIVSAMSENWFVYSFWGDIVEDGPAPSTSKGYQLVVSELYESPIPNDRGPLGSASNFSSIESTFVKPFVKSQSYIISEELSSLAITETRQGITSRDLLASLTHSKSIVAIPKAALNPGRPIGRDATSEEAEEGLVRYNPILEFDPKWVITHKREVLGIRKIIATPALLESTSLAFAYGIDLFGTRVAPSMEFDILGKGFGKTQLVGTILALGASVSFLAPMVRRKTINARWQTS